MHLSACLAAGSTAVKTLQGTNGDSELMVMDGPLWMHWPLAVIWCALLSAAASVLLAAGHLSLSSCERRFLMEVTIALVTLSYGLQCECRLLLAAYMELCDAELTSLSVQGN